MNLDEIFPKLPKPNVEHARQFDELNEEGAKGMFCNPIYVGIPPFDQIVSDEAWVNAAAALIREEGPEQYLVNLLHVLRASMADVHTADLTAEDYDDLWIDDDDLEISASLAEDIDAAIPWHLPLEGTLFCSHDDLPMLFLNGEYVCVAEYLNAHIDGAPITDIITAPIFTLVFQNGHTLPLLCPSCGDSIHIENDTIFLDTLNDLIIVGMWWDDEEEVLTLEFGQVDDSDYPADGNLEVIHSLPIHLNSVRGLTCPNLEAESEP